ncbi:MAG: methyltransferase [Desulfurococcales archaeon]|nr:methyltransferase [Desulfurococcales archaeon]
MVKYRINFNPANGIALDKHNVDKYAEQILCLDKYLVGEIKKSRIVYFYNIDTKSIYPLERRESGYKALVTLGPNVPYTLRINGIHMHRIWGIDPLTDSEIKVKAARIGRHQKVLDTCMGLGYTAVKSLQHGAEVTTVEKDLDVIWIAEHNPYSQNLEDTRVKVIHGDILLVIKEFLDNAFDRIIHDPPRLTASTGDLYGISFYRNLYRVLKPGGILFHYTGLPGRKRGINLLGKTASRLEKAGFYPVIKNRRAQGVVAIKPLDE